MVGILLPLASSFSGGRGAGVGWDCVCAGGFALVDVDGIAVGIGDKEEAANGAVHDSGARENFGDGDAVAFQMGEGGVEVFDFEGDVGAVVVSGWMGVVGEGEGAVPDVVFDPPFAAAEVFGHGFLKAEDFAIEFAGARDVGDGIGGEGDGFDFNHVCVSLDGLGDYLLCLILQAIHATASKK